MSEGISTLERHLVIGAGPVGLAMAAALKRRGIPFDLVDAGSGVGGNWLHGVYRTAHIVSSKKATEYTDYPMPADYPDFPSADQMLAYLTAFAKDRGLLASAEFNKKVASAAPDTSGRWTVKFEDGEERTYKGVVVCNGHHWDKRYPTFRGDFTGEILHSKDYVGARPDRRQTPPRHRRRQLRRRHGVRCGSLRPLLRYQPADRATGICRKHFSVVPLTDLPIWGLPIFVQRALLKTDRCRLSIGDYRRYGLQKPNHKIFDRHPAFGTDLLTAIRLGTREATARNRSRRRTKR